jgi:hypothetical protein
MTDMQVKLEAQDHTVNFLQASLFHGIAPVEVEDKRRASVMVEMIKNTNDIYVQLYDDSVNTLPGYTVEITGSNGAYGYDNSKLHDTTLLYTPLNGYRQITGSGIQADFRVMRLFVNDSMILTIKQYGVSVYQYALTGAIMHQMLHIKNNRDFDRYDEYILGFKVDAGKVISIIGGGELNGENGNELNGGGELNGENGNELNGGGELNGENGNESNGGGSLNGTGGSSGSGAGKIEIGNSLIEK